MEHRDGFVNIKLNITCISDVFVLPLKKYLKKLLQFAIQT